MSAIHKNIISNMMSECFAENSIEHTPTNELDFLVGIRDAWIQDGTPQYLASLTMEQRDERMTFMTEISFMIMTLRFAVVHEQMEATS